MTTLTFVFFVTLITISHVFPSAEQGCRRQRRVQNIRLRQDNIIDLTYVFDERTPSGRAVTGVFKLFDHFKAYITTPFSYFAQYYSFSTPEHAGTHMDAPAHFQEDKLHTDEVPLQSLMGQGVLINLVENGEKFGKDSLVSIEHFLDWEKGNGRIRSGSIILLRTGYGDVYYEREKYFGTNLTGVEAIKIRHFPGLHQDAAKWLISNRCIRAIGIDTPGIDFAQTKNFSSHQVLCKENIPIFENVANLDQLLARNKKGFNIIALPIKIKGGSGGPVRIIAVLN